MAGARTIRRDALGPEHVAGGVIHTAIHDELYRAG
jgi:hypothetical protein